MTKPKPRSAPMIVKGDIVLFTCEGDPNHGKEHRVAAVFVDPDDQKEMATIVPLEAGLEDVDTPIDGYLRLMRRAAASETPSPAQGEGPQAGGGEPPAVSSLNSPAADKAAGDLSKETPKKLKGRGNPHKSDNAVLAQSDEALQSQLREVLTLKADLDEKTAAQRTANSLYRSAIKVAAKIGGAMGLTTADVVWFVTASGRDVADVDAETRRRNRIAELMKLPLGTQLGLLDGQPNVPGAEKITVATAIEDRKLATADPGIEGTDAEIELGGYKAYQMGMTSAEVPAFGAPDDRRKDIWMTGWNRAKDEVAQKAAKALGKPHPTPGTKKLNGQHPPAAIADALAPAPKPVDDDVQVF